MYHYSDRLRMGKAKRYIFLSKLHGLYNFHMGCTIIISSKVTDIQKYFLRLSSAIWQTNLNKLKINTEYLQNLKYQAE